MKKLIALLLICSLAACATKKETAAAPGSTPPKPAAQSTPAQPKKSLWATLMAPLGKIFPRKQPPPSAIPPRLIGQITSVNQDNHFVLIDGITMQGAKAGDTLVCISNQQITSTLRMSALKSSPFLIADIISGTPAAGERVYLQESPNGS